MTVPQHRKSWLIAFTSWRVGAVSLLSISSGLPLGLVWLSVPTWMAAVGVDIKTVGLITLAQAPYSFKFVWAPLMDRLWPPFLGRKRGWILVTQLALAALFGALATVATSPTVGVISALLLAISFASSTQDIAVDAYTVEVLRDGEQGAAAGTRTAMYRVAMWISGNAAISVGPIWGWDVTIWALAGLFIVLIPVTLLAPEPDTQPAPPTSLRAAVWEPFIGFLSRPRALEIAAFLFLYKLADNLAGALIRPVLQQHGYDAWDVGVGSGTATLISIALGTFIGGVLTERITVTKALWIFGVIQGLSNVGYAVVAAMPVDRTLLYVAVSLENFTGGLGTAAFSFLMIRLTEKRFSATQYALLSSLFGLGRTLTGPPSGALADALGWSAFFLLSIPAAIPGLIMLRRFAPFSSPTLIEISGDDAKPIERGEPWEAKTLWARGGASALFAIILGIVGAASLTALKTWRETKQFDLGAAIISTVTPAKLADSLDLIGAILFGGLVGLAVAATLAARGKPRSVAGR
ncbi:MAG: AmpG family muropeptide MFS transporter [Archangiaceae bacterium]|nr:AmpG family muropeptide MFS transporter [Archangiaceae bacterium]